MPSRASSIAADTLCDPCMPDASLLKLMTSQLPQLFENYKAKDASGLSMAFLFVWLMGDVSNLSGELALRPLVSSAYQTTACRSSLPLLPRRTYRSGPGEEGGFPVIAPQR